MSVVQEDGRKLSTTVIDVERDAAPPEHPTGALAFMLVYLVLLALLWTHAYLKLWGS